MLHAYPPGQPDFSVPTRAMLGTMSADSFVTGVVALEMEAGTKWELQDGLAPADSTATQAINCAAGPGTPSPTRHWARIPGSGFDSFKYQQAWHVNPLTGSNVAAGDSAHPLASVEELRLRIWQDQRADMVVYLHGNTTECYRGFYSDFQMRFEGVPTETVRTASATVAYDCSSGVNESNTITDNAALAWAPYIGKFVKIGTSYAVVLKDQTAGLARLGQWLNTIGVGGQAAPAAGAYSLLVLPTITIIPSASTDFDPMDPERNVTYRLVKVSFTTGYATGKFTLCELNHTVVTKVGRNSYARGCGWSAPDVFTYLNVGEKFDFSGSSLYKVAIQGNPGGDACMTWCTGQVAQLIPGYEPDTGRAVYGGSFWSGDGALGLFDSTGAAVQVALGWFSHSATSGTKRLFGKGNATGLVLGTQGRVRVPSGSTLTGTTELDVGAGPFPKLVAGAAVPATSALTTWANLAAAPYSGYAQTPFGGIISTV